MIKLMCALLVAVVTAIGCSSSTKSDAPASSANHLFMVNNTNVSLVFIVALSADDSVDWQTFTNQITKQSSDVVASTTVAAGVTQPWPTPARGHYRWGYLPAGSSSHVPLHDATFDVLDAVTDIHLTAGSTTIGDGGISTPADGGNKEGGSCLPSGSQCSESNDNCCTVCGLNQAGICA